MGSSSKIQKDDRTGIIREGRRSLTANDGRYYRTDVPILCEHCTLDLAFEYKGSRKVSSSNTPQEIYRATCCGRVYALLTLRRVLLVTTEEELEREA